MNGSDKTVQTTLRIPGNWSHPEELSERMPAGVRLTPGALILPGGGEIEFSAMPSDDQFAHVFRTACRCPATHEEMKSVSNYTMNVGLIGSGGSRQAALTLMQAGAAIVRAGGVGVFIDNSLLAHGGERWIEMAEDASSDALSFAFIGIVRGEHEVWTMGMHVLGLADVVMRRADLEPDRATIIELIRYMCRGEKPICHGHVLADEEGLCFRALATADTKFNAGSPMYNPFGRLKLVSMKDIAEGN